jgi:DNA-binding NarL/FixJ family response regulator
MRVLIADDHPLFRDGLRSLLEARGIDVVGEATNGRDAVEKTRRLRPEVVLMDLRNILDKLHVQNRAQVVAYAVRHALVDTPEHDRPLRSVRIESSSERFARPDPPG